MDSCPSQSAITVCSTPACSKSIAVVWRRQWKVTFFCFRDGQASLATATCFFRRRATASALSRPPRMLGKRSEEHTSELQSHLNLVCRLLLEKKKHEQ